MMTITIDTNVLFRIFVKDGGEQWEVAARLLKAHRVVVMPTVLLETEWVLRSVARYSRPRIIQLFRSMLASRDFVISERAGVMQAMASFDAGMDFADAMHVSFTAEDTTFVTFDRDLVRRAKRTLPNASVELAHTL